MLYMHLMIVLIISKGWVTDFFFCCCCFKVHGSAGKGFLSFIRYCALLRSYTCILVTVFTLVSHPHKLCVWVYVFVDWPS